MMNVETRALVVFKVASLGGMGAIAGLVASFTRNGHLGYPVVTLSTGSYRNKKHGGFTSFPVFVNDGFEKLPVPGVVSGGNSGDGGDGGDGARVIGTNKVAPERDREVDDMDDDLPF